MPSLHSNFLHYLKSSAYCTQCVSVKSLLFVSISSPNFFLCHWFIICHSTSNSLNLIDNFVWWSLPYYSIPCIFCKLVNLETFLDSCSNFQARMFCRWCCRCPMSLYQETCYLVVLLIIVKINQRKHQVFHFSTLCKENLKCVHVDTHLPIQQIFPENEFQSPMHSPQRQLRSLRNLTQSICL